MLLEKKRSKEGRISKKQPLINFAKTSRKWSVILSCMLFITMPSSSFFMMSSPVAPGIYKESASPTDSEEKSEIVVATTTDSATATDSEKESEKETKNKDISDKPDETENNSSEEESDSEYKIMKGDEEAALHPKKTSAEAFGKLRLLAAPSKRSPESINGYIDYSDYLKSHKIMYNGKELVDGDIVIPSQKYELELHFRLEQGQMDSVKYYYKLPEHVGVGDQGSEESPITLYNSNHVPIGTYYIKDNIIFVDYPGFYEDVFTNFALEGSWDNVDNQLSFTIQWPDRNDTYHTNPSDITVVKNKTDYVPQEDGSLLCTYKVKITPNTSGVEVNDVKLTDTFTVNHLELDKERFDDKYAFKLQIYDNSGSVTTEKYFKYSDVSTASGKTITTLIDDIDIPADGYAMVSYAAIMPVKERMKIEASNSGDLYTNKARASYIVTDSTDGSTRELYSETSIYGTYEKKGEWVYKEAGKPEKTRIINNIGYTVVPYTVTINKHRYYSLGGSVIHDSITGFLGGTVKYDTSTGATTKIVMINSENPGGVTVKQKWVILSAEDYSALEACVNKSGSDTALSRLNASPDVVSRITAAINAKYGTSLSTLTDDAALTYIFTTDTANDFIWLMPHDNEPTSYMIHYDTIAEQTVGSFKNSASMWYTDMEGVPYGPGNGTVNPIKKVMNSTKHNEGVYIGADGNYYVDYTLTVGLPANSAGFDVISVFDYFPIREVKINGENKNVADWLVGMSEYSLQGSDRFENLNNCFTITTDSERADVQAVANRAYVIPWNGKNRGSRYTGVQSNWEKSFREDACFESAVDGALVYSGTDMEAGQFIAGKTSQSIIRKGSTYSLYDIAIFLGELPDTIGKEAYDITIKYSMMVNPVLIQKLEEEINEVPENYIVQQNDATTNTSYFYGNETTWRMDDSTSSIISGMSSTYWLGTGPDLPDIEKAIPDDGYSDTDETLEYKITIAPDGGQAEKDSYVISDQLNVAGMKYKNNTFELREGNTVIWSERSGASSGYAGKISFKKTSENSKANGFELILDNSTGLFQDTSNKMKKFVLTYKVDLAGYDTDLTIENTVGLSKVLYDSDGKEKGRERIAEDTSEYAIDKALDKKLIELPSESNHYVGKFQIDINPDSDNARELKTLSTGDEFTVKDTFGNDLTLDIDNVKVTEITDTGTEIDITGSSVLRYSKESNIFEAVITYTEGSKYKIEYNAKIAGKEGRTSIMANDVEIPNTTVKADSIRDRIYVYNYSGDADANVYNIKFEKYDVNHIDYKISGARFELYRYDTESQSWDELTDGQEERPDYIETDDQGKASIKSLSTSSTKKLVQLGYYYKLVEIKTEEGYILDDTPIYYYVYNTNTDDEGKPVAQKAAPEEVSKAGYTTVALATLGEDEFIPLILLGNSKFGFEIEKKDKSAGNIVTGSGFTLYRDEACTDVIATVSDDDKDGNLVFEDIPNISTGSGTYYLKETKVPTGYVDKDEVFTLNLKDGYIDSISGSEGTKITIDNTGRKSLITIPNTSDKETYLRVTKETKPASFETASFPFSIILTDQSGDRLTGSYPATITRRNGDKENISFKNNNVIYLASGDEIFFSSLPEGTSYKVSETIDNNYRTTVQVADTAGTDSAASKTAFSASGTLEVGEEDTISFVNTRLRDITIIKSCEDQNGAAINIPDGLRIEISNSYGSKEIEAEWDASLGKFVLKYRANDRYTFDNSVDSGFKVGSLPIANYHVYEYGAEIGGYTCMLKYRNGDTGSYYTDLPHTGTTTVGGSSKLNLVNVYTRKALKASLKAKKILEGRAIKDGEFNFELLYLGKNISSIYSNGSERIIDRQKCKADGSVNFDLSFAELSGITGKYYYAIREVIPDGAVNNIYNDVKYIKKTYYAKIIISEDKTTKVLSISEPMYMTSFSSSDSAATIDVDDVKFTNEYVAAEGAWKPGLTKQLTGRNGKAGEFTFKLAKVASNYTTPILDDSGNPIVYTLSSPAVNADVKTNMSFDDIVYDEDDIGKTYYYVMSEDIPSDAVNKVKKGVTYDDHKVKIKVTIEKTDNRNSDGKYILDVKTDIVEGKTDFVNKYNASVTVPFTGSKVLYGRNILGNNEFHFAARLEVDGRVEINDTIFGYAGTDGKLYFLNGTSPSLSFNQNHVGKDVKLYVWELIPIDAQKLPGITYDTSIITADIDITDKGDGTLSASVKYLDQNNKSKSGFDFENEYSAEAFLTFTADKLLTGYDLEENRFTFEIYEGTKLVSTGKNDVNGNITFAPIRYYVTGTKDSVTKNTGEHTYIVKEKIPDGVDANNTLDGVTYDDTEYEVKVTAEDDLKGGMNFTVTGAALDTAGLTYKIDTPNDKNADFVNEYEAAGDFTFDGVKTLTGRDLKKGEFTFTIEEFKLGNNDYVPTGRKFTGINEEDGKIIFDKIEFKVDKNTNDTGIYKYIVKEDIPEDKKGITYDSTEITVGLAVVDDGKGSLIVDPDINNDKIEYTNVYEANGAIRFSGKKDIENLDKMISGGSIKEGDYSFSVYEYDGSDDEYEKVCADTTELVYKPISKGTVKDDGNIAFDKIDYELTDVGTHYYVIREDVNVGKDNVINTTVPVQAVVQVSDNGDGTLMVDASYKKDGKDEAEAEFINLATEVEIEKLDVKFEKLTGATLQILDADGNVITSFESGNESVKIYGLSKNKAYVLHEDKAPDGYEKADDIQFTIDEKGIVHFGELTGKISMIDKEKVEESTTEDKEDITESTSEDKDEGKKTSSDEEDKDDETSTENKEENTESITVEKKELTESTTEDKKKSKKKVKKSTTEDKKLTEATTEQKTKSDDSDSKKETTKSNNAKTGDSGIPVVMFVLMLISVMGIYLVRKKQKK